MANRPRRESLLESLVAVLYPPAASMLALAGRRARAVRLWRLVGAFSDGHGVPALWRSAARSRGWAHGGAAFSGGRRASQEALSAP